MTSASQKNFKKAAGLMLVAILASKFLGLIREMLIAHQFGQTGSVSAYTAAFNLPDLLFFFLSSGALSSAFIPVFTERFETGRQKEAWQIFSIIACLMGIVLTATVIVFWVFAKPLVSVFAVPGFVDQYPELVPLTVLLTRIILPCQLFFFVGGLMMATLQSRQNFKATAAAPVIYNLGIIFGAIVLSKWFSIAGLAIGTLIGAFVGNILYAFYWLRKEGVEFHPSLNIRHPGVIRVATLALPVILGLGLPQIDVIINRWFASFVSASAPAALNYANRLMQVPLGIFAQAAGTAILPMLAACAAKNAFEEMRSGVGFGLRGVMVESIPSTVFLIVMADPLIRTLFMSGQFKPSSVGTAVIPLIWYSVGIFGWAGQRIVAPGFFALQDTITPVVIGTVSTIIFIPLNFFLMKTMGIGGIALSTSIAISFHFLAMTFFLRRRLHGIEGGQIMSTVGRVLVAGAVMAVVCFGVRLGMARIVGSWQLQDGDIKNPVVFATMLENDQSPLSSYLNSKMSEKTISAVRDNTKMEQMSPELGSELAADINNWIKSAPSRNAQIARREKLSSAYPEAILSPGSNSTWLTRLVVNKKANKARITHIDGMTTSDIIDVSALVIDISNNKKALSRQLSAALDASTKSTLKTYNRLYESAQKMPQLMMHDLNTIIKDENIYTADRFTGVSIPKNIHIGTNYKGSKLAEANRRLLEAAYPAQIVKRPIDRVESRLGSMFTVLVAMLFSGIVYFALLRVLKVTEMDYLFSALKRKIFKRGGGNDIDSTPIPPIDGTIEP